MGAELRERLFAAKVLHDVVQQWREMIEIESAIDVRDVRMIGPGDLVWWHYAPAPRYTDELCVPAVVIKIFAIKATIEFERIEHGEVVRQKKTVALKKISRR